MSATVSLKKYPGLTMATHKTETALDKRKRRMARLRAFVAMTSPEKLPHVKKRVLCSCCSWLKFGVITFIIMLCLGVSLLIAGGILMKIDVLILGGVFVVGSFVFFCVIFSPYRASCNCCNCCPNGNRITDTIIEETPHTVQVLKEKPMLEKTGKRLSFRSALNKTIQTEVSPRSLSSSTTSSRKQSFDKSWVKLVERKAKSTDVIQEETIDEDTRISDSRNSKHDNLKIEHERGDKRQVMIKMDRDTLNPVSNIRVNSVDKSNTELKSTDDQQAAENHGSNIHIVEVSVEPKKELLLDGTEYKSNEMTDIQNKPLTINEERAKDDYNKYNYNNITGDTNDNYTANKEVSDTEKGRQSYHFIIDSKENKHTHILSEVEETNLNFERTIKLSKVNTLEEKTDKTVGRHINILFNENEDRNHEFNRTIEKLTLKDNSYEQTGEQTRKKKKRKKKRRKKEKELNDAADLNYAEPEPDESALTDSRENFSSDTLKRLDTDLL